jgi:hypothetical protein
MEPRGVITPRTSTNCFDFQKVGRGNTLYRFLFADCECAANKDSSSA